MQRIRISMPYYRGLGWEPVVLCVDERMIDGYVDELLSETVPPDIDVHRVGAWPEKYTRKLGVGRLGFRSYYHIKKKGTELLKSQKFDLIFFFNDCISCLCAGTLLEKEVWCSLCY